MANETEPKSTNPSGEMYATGKRKTAIARVWLKPGSGRIIVNQKPFEEFFDRVSSQMIIMQPMELINIKDSYDVKATVKGGGKSGQAEALRHGISRALSRINPEYRSVLKRVGFITRDSRAKERKKYGQRGARARFQFSKR